MNSGLLPTRFAPAERADSDIIARQHNLFTATPVFNQILDANPNILLALNKERQIVYANQALLDFIDLQDQSYLTGLRPGEALNCVHAGETEGGCGTTEFCKTCGAAKAILASQKGEKDIQECRISRTRDAEPLDLRVWTQPIYLGEEHFTIFAVSDISHEKRRRALEQIFFHDVLNIAGILRLMAEYFPDAEPEEYDEIMETVFELSDSLIEEINVQKDLIAAENNELTVKPTSISSLALLNKIVSFFIKHKLSEDRNIVIDNNSKDIEIVTDETLLKRVVTNMIKNALEASNPNETVTLGCHQLNDSIQFWVHNLNYMPREVQLQIFQRSFSTRGGGRGLGTYSMKLLSERYLKGKVSFTSSEDHGTTFEATYPIELSKLRIG